MEAITDAFCRRVSEAIARESVPGMGTWDRTWTMLDGPSQEFLRRLKEMEAGRVGPKYVGEAGNEIIKAFRRAKREYQKMRGKVRAT